MTEIKVCLRGSGVAYEAAGHHDIEMHRLVGSGALESSFIRLMRLEYAETGRVEFAVSDQEKIYVCIAGEVLVGAPDQEILLRAGDVCLIAPGCSRTIRNRASAGSELLLIMPR